MKNNNTATSLVSFNHFITNPKTSDYLAQVLGEQKENFITNIVSLVSNNVNLQTCTPATIMYSAIKATTLGLPLDNNLGFAYVLPYNNTKKGVTEAQFQMGYKGFIQLAMRSGQFLTINSTDVRDGEIVSNDRLTGELKFNWLENEARDKAKIIGFVAYFELTNGFKKSLYMTSAELEAHGQKYSKSYNTKFSNWKKLFSAMASKTVIKLLLSKYAPLSIQMAEAVKYDQAVIRAPHDAQYVDVSPTIEDSPEADQSERISEFIASAETVKELDEIRKKLDSDNLAEFNDALMNKEHELSVKN